MPLNIDFSDMDKKLDFLILKVNKIEAIQESMIEKGPLIKPLLTFAEAMDYMKTSRRIIDRMIDDKKITPVLLTDNPKGKRYFKRKELEDLILGDVLQTA